MFQDIDAPLDGAYESRRRNKEIQERAVKQHQERVVREELSNIEAILEKHEFDRTIAGRELRRSDQVLQENPTPEEEEVKKELFKSSVYSLLSLAITVAGALLAFSILGFVIRGFDRLIRWFVSGALVGCTIIAFHWMTSKLGEKLQRFLVIALLVVALANICLLAWIRAEYTAVIALQERNQITQTDLQEKKQKLDSLLVFVHIFMALSFELLGALAANRAGHLFNEHWPNWKRYRNRRFWENECARLDRLIIEVKHRIQFLQNEQEVIGSDENANY